MPITIACACGRRLRAPEGYAGRQVRCPACGAVLTVPAAADATAGVPADDTYELAEPPPQPRRAPAPPPPPAAGATATTHPAPPDQVPSLHARLAQRALQRAAAGRQGPRPLFNVLGVEFTRTRLAVTVVLLLLLLLGSWWLFTVGPAAKAVVVAAYPVTATPLLRGLDTRHPYNLFTGEGDRSLGVQGMPAHQPGGAAAGGAAPSDAPVYSLGAGDTLVHARPDPQGRQLLIRTRIAHGLFDAQGHADGFNMVVRPDAFTLEPLGAGTPLRPTILYTRFADRRLDLDLAGADTSDYAPLLPADVPPTNAKLEARHGGHATGTITFQPASGAQGQLDFTSFHFLSGAPGVNGLAADGQVQRTLPNGGAAVYDYRGDTLHLTWPDGEAWWTKPQFTRKQGLSSFQKLDVALLFERPTPGGRYRLKFGGYTLGTIDTNNPGTPPGDADAPPPPPPAPPQPTPTLAQQQQQNPTVTGYFQLLADARNKARGVVAASNMTQIGVALQLYAQQHGGELPEKLQDLRTLMPQIDQLLVNPRTKENPGFIYRKPPTRLTQLSSPAQTPILWEAKAGQIDPAGAILYADGHLDMP